MVIKRKDLQKAEKFLSQGKYNKAIDLYVAILKKDPNDSTLLNTLGDVYIRINKPEKAITYFRKSAQHYEQSGFRTKAIAILRKAHRQSPNNLEIINNLTEFLQEEGLLADARQILLELAESRYQQKKYSDAKFFSRKILDIDPNHLASLIRIAEIAEEEGNIDEEVETYMLLADRLSQTARFEEALEIIEIAHRKVPENVDIARMFSNLLIRVGDMERADAVLATLSAVASSDVNILTAMVETTLEAGEINRAKVIFDKARAVDPNNERVLLLGYTLSMREEDFETAYEYLLPLIDKISTTRDGGPVVLALEELASHSPKPMTALHQLKHIYSILGDRKSLVNTMIHLARVHREAGDIQLAIEIAEEIQGLEPNVLLHKNRLEELYNLSDGAFHFQRPDVQSIPNDLPEELDIDFSDIIEKTDPGTGKMLSEAKVLIKYGFSGKAKKRLEAAKQLDKDNPEIPEIAADIFIEEGNFPAAIKSIELARDLWNSLGKTDKAEILSRDIKELKEGKTDRADVVIDEDSLDLSFLETVGTGSEHETSAGETHLEEVEQLERRISEARSYIDQKLFVDADEIINSLLEQAPENQAVKELQDQFENLLETEHGNTLATEPPEALSSREEDISEADSDEAQGVDQIVEVQTPAKDSASMKDTSILSDIASTLEDELLAVHSAAEKRLSKMDKSDRPIKAERILGHLGSDYSLSALQEDSGKHYEMGLAYRETGLFEDAINDFQIAAEDPVYYQKACLQLGICYLHKQMHDSAIDWLQKGISGGGDMQIMADSLYQLALIYQMIGEDKAFSHAVDQLDSLAPQHAGLATLKSLL